MKFNYIGMKEAKRHKKIMNKFAKTLSIISDTLLEIDIIKSINLSKNEIGEVELDIEYEEGVDNENFGNEQNLERDERDC